MIKVINYQFKIPEGANVINTTSRSKDFGRGLSPFLIGPCDLYDDHVSKNMENSWQFSKVYREDLEEDGSIGEKYFKWAKEGWNDDFAHRYPKGKDAKPLFSYWAGEKLDYVEARKKIYIPLYSEAVRKTEAWKKLKDLYEEKKSIFLVDFDSYNLSYGIDYWALWNNPNIKVGHAYVLAMMLEGII